MSLKKIIKHKIYQFLGPDSMATIPIINYNAPEHGLEYQFNKQIDMKNINVKNSQIQRGEKFESDYMYGVNTVIGKFLCDVKNIVNVGCGVGTFESIHAPKNPNISFLACDYDLDSIDWCKKNRPFPNVEYRNCITSDLLKQEKKFDIAFSIDVIEHLKDYKNFLDDFSQLADKAVFSTPNRERYTTWEELLKPVYPYHVQEFNPGELFFILKMYYTNVELYTFNYNTYSIEKIGFYTKLPQIIAFCQK